MTVLDHFTLSEPQQEQNGILTEQTFDYTLAFIYTSNASRRLALQL